MHHRGLAKIPLAEAGLPITCLPKTAMWPEQPSPPKHQVRLLVSALQSNKRAGFIRIRLFTKPHNVQRKQISTSVRRLCNIVRQILETISGRLGAQFSIETDHAHTFRGQFKRPHTKLAAHSHWIYKNVLQGVQDYLQFKKLAFPNLCKSHFISRPFAPVRQWNCGILACLYAIRKKASFQIERT